MEDKYFVIELEKTNSDYFVNNYYRQDTEQSKYGGLPLQL